MIGLGHFVASRRESLQRQATALLIGPAGTAGCLLLNTPLPWMIGPLLATAIASMAGLQLSAATVLRNAGQWAIGTALGLYFTPPVVAAVAGLWPVVIAGIAWALLLGTAFGGWLLVANRGLAGLGRPTAFFASAIGGASEMALLAERHGGRIDLVVSAHSLRLLMVVVLVPFGFQWAGLHGLDPTAPGRDGRSARAADAFGGLSRRGAGDGAAEAVQSVGARAVHGCVRAHRRRYGAVGSAAMDHQPRSAVHRHLARYPLHARSSTQRRAGSRPLRPARSA